MTSTDWRATPEHAHIVKHIYEPPIVIPVHKNKNGIHIYPRLLNCILDRPKLRNMGVAYLCILVENLWSCNYVVSDNG